jgi:beta-glucanase (GH16 family)
MGQMRHRAMAGTAVLTAYLLASVAATTGPTEPAMPVPGASPTAAVVACSPLDTSPRTPPLTGASATTAGPAAPRAATDCAGNGTTAAETFKWGKPNRADEFDGGKPGAGWYIYDGAGHNGQGRRSPSAVSVGAGILTITGDSSGTTAGMAWNPGQKYGRWEARVKSPASDPSYNSLLLLWPDAENWPAGGEIDFMEISDHTRQQVDMFVHYGAQNAQTHARVTVDATQWHNWAVEWTPDHIAAFVDGKQWYRTTDPAVQPPGPMHLCIQLDWFPRGKTPAVSNEHVAWVRQYPVAGASATP